jgi:hypothetical protein
VITVEKVREPNVGRRSGAPNIYLPHVWWFVALIVMSVDYIIRCVD